MLKTDQQAKKILLAEDNPGDVLLTKHAFADAKIKNIINVVQDGEETLDYLYKRGAFKNATTPDLILLDLNMPKKDGRDVLKEIKLDKYLRRIPVIVLSSSKAEQDLIKTYDLHANAYILKPLDLDRFTEIVTAVENFWFSSVLLPPPPPPHE